MLVLDWLSPPQKKPEQAMGQALHEYDQWNVVT